jgi:hypothetical protein
VCLFAAAKTCLIRRCVGMDMSVMEAVVLMKIV